MKQRYSYAILFLILLGAFSCRQAEEQPDIEAIEAEMAKGDSATVAAVVADTAGTAAAKATEALAKECIAYFEEWEKLRAASTDYYRTVVLPKALANPRLPEQNMAFLLALEIYLSQTPEEIRAIPTTNQLLFPIFKVNEKEMGVFAFPAYDTASEDFIDISIENNILARSKLTATIDSSAQYKVVFHPELADSLLKTIDPTVTAFTAKGKVKTKVVNFGSYAGECLEYYNYLLDSKPFSKHAKVLFGSIYNLSLAYRNYPKVDATMLEQLNEKCFDCPSSMEEQKTFATLEGVEGLYFAYADTFPLNNKLDTPSRALVMDMDGKMIYLWYQEVDLAGCSCI
ncbi:hypothetical protein [Pontibacter akesuensis]|uniref:Uncharacterized protein n=1 Tax=Pontibacter akesuensis TaxID=388950 RepID=A0A1I7I283_9BACT|nr:hypothetical protein [Pontibacter akesuensis]GHA64821.1 hypothetical protein GCM10007389_16960 [Pontibacter akesuensis]SFU67059.1 hypothetical protein SAMN04487941_1857 [Pontibacter akesuensis]